MMKTFSNMSEAELLLLQQKLKRVHHDLIQAVIPLTRENILTEQEASEVFGVTSRTMRKYRQKRYIGAIKLDGRVLYLRNMLYLDLEALYHQSKKKRE